VEVVDDKPQAKLLPGDRTENRVDPNPPGAWPKYGHDGARIALVVWNRV